MSELHVQKISAKLLDELLLQARLSPRRRVIHRLHRGDWEHSHRMLNALAVGTYVAPHQHADRYQSEGFILLRGRLGVLLFDADGSINRAASSLLSIADGMIGLDIPPQTWHTLVALEDSVIYEVKGHPAGGYVQERDKNFAAWAPAEGEAAAVEYLKSLEAIARSLNSAVRQSEP